MTSKEMVENAIEEGKYIGGGMVNIIISLTNLGNLKSDLERLEKLEKAIEILLPQTIKKIVGVPETLDLYQIKYKKVVSKVHKDLILEIVDILNKKEVLDDE